MRWYSKFQSIKNKPNWFHLLVHTAHIISFVLKIIPVRKAWRYQSGNNNPYIEEQTTQWPKEKVQTDKQRSTKHTHKTKDRVTRTPLKTGGEFRCSGRVGNFCSTNDTRRVNLVTIPVISHVSFYGILFYDYWFIDTFVIFELIDFHSNNGHFENYITC